MLWAPGDGSALLGQTENDATEGNPSGEETPTTLQSHLPTSWAHPWDKSISPPSAPCQHLSRGRSTQQKSFSPDMSNGMSSTNSPALGTAAADGHRALLGVLGRCVKHSHVLSCMGTHAVRLGGGTERTGTTPPGSNEDGWLLGRCVGRGGHPGGAESWEQSHEATTLCRPRPAEGTCIHYSGCQQDLQPVCPTGQHLPGTDTSGAKRPTQHRRPQS